MATANKENPSVLEQLLDEGNIGPEQREITEKGLDSFLNTIVSQGQDQEKISAKLVDQMLADIDEKISAQMDEVLHHADFQKLESTWRGLDYLIKHTNFHENIRLNLLPATKDELHTDLEDSPSLTESGVYKHVYTGEYGQFGGKPFGGIIGSYEFGPGSRDVSLLGDMAAIGGMSFAPFLAAASPEFFTIDSWDDLADLKDLDSIFEMPQYGKWNTFRQTEDARNVGLAMPRFMLREPYGEDMPVKSFNYNESVAENSDYLWGNAAYALASRITDSFAEYRWGANIIGPRGGGKVEDLPLYTYEAMGQTQTKIPTDILISERREYELAENGFIPLTMRKGGGDAVFFSANSCQLAKEFPDTPAGREAQLNYRLSTQFPYLFVVSRLAHYIKILQRENLGSWKGRAEIERELNEWISQYVVDMADPGPGIRSKKPLRAAQVTVEDIESDPGWYRCSLLVSPHFKYMGANFTLSLVGKLEKQAG